MVKRQGHFYWKDSRTNGLLSQGSFQLDDLETVDAIYQSEEDAENYLQNLADQNPELKDRLQGCTLYKDGQKVMQGADVLTEQQGLGDFMTDGGYNREHFLNELHDIYVAIDHTDDPEKEEELAEELEYLKAGHHGSYASSFM